MTVVFDDRALYVPASDTLVVADLHLDYTRPSDTESAPLVAPDIEARFDQLVTDYAPAEVVFAGDLFETAERPPQAAADAFTALCDRAYQAGARVIVTPGNHDRCGFDLAPILPDPSTPEYELAAGETVVMHGHRTPTLTADRFVIGHMHPMVTVAGDRKPCYLVAPDAYHETDVIVLPPFNQRIYGVNVSEALAGRANAPLVRESMPFDDEATQCLWWDDQTERATGRSLATVRES